MGCRGSRENTKNGQFFVVYSLGKKLGQGSFGQVREATKRATDEVNVAKIIDIRLSPDDDDTTIDTGKVSEVRNECKLWRQLGNTNACVVKLFETFQDQGVFYMVMEKCRCSLLDNLEEMLQMSHADIIRIFREMLQGIKHLHSCNVAHRDVKLDNFLVGDDGIVKIADFGLAIACSPNSKLTGVAGTPPYMAPEMLWGQRYGTKVDLWAFGTTAYVILYGSFPYGQHAKSADEMKDAIATGKPPPSYRRPGETAKVKGEDFVAGILERDPANRASAADALGMGFINPMLLRRQDSQVVWGSETAELKHVGQMVRMASVEFKEQPVDPTVQRSLDDLLQRLERRRNADMFHRSFSLPTSENTMGKRKSGSAYAVGWTGSNGSGSVEPQSPKTPKTLQRVKEEDEEEEFLRSSLRRRSITRAQTYGGDGGGTLDAPSTAPISRSELVAESARIRGRLGKCGSVDDALIRGGGSEGGAGAASAPLAPLAPLDRRALDKAKVSPAPRAGAILRSSSSSTKSNESTTPRREGGSAISTEEISWSKDDWLVPESDQLAPPRRPPPLPQCNMSAAIALASRPNSRMPGQEFPRIPPRPPPSV
mmetsp:Transcript_14670/g.31983  ORF Transcript_14670/g.31983 Transcript_14670/m.31983 type:complete len:596 (+) Transcript_14670:137-1924(+)